MATRKMTFSIPDSLASEFLKSVPARERSKYVAETVATRLRKQHEALIRACGIANRDDDVLAIEREFDASGGDIAEPWINASKG
jgi:stage V sporulation protein SpoVS